MRPRRSPTFAVPEARFEGNGTARRRAPPLQSLGAGAEPDHFVRDRRAAGALSPGDEPDAVSTDDAGLGDGFQRTVSKLSPAAGRSPFCQFAGRVGQAVVLGRAVPGPARHAAGAVVERSIAFCGARAYVLP